MTGYLSVGEICRMTGQPDWKVRRVCDRLQPRIEVFGRNRIVPVSRLPEVTQGLATIKAGRPRKAAAAAAAEGVTRGS